MTDGTALTLRTMNAGASGRRNLVVALAALAAAAIAALLLAMPGPGSGPAAGTALNVDGPAALLRLPAAARGPISSALGRAVAGYQITGLTATNRAQRLSARFGFGGVTVRSGAARFDLRLSGLGRDGATRTVAAVAPVRTGGSILYARPGLRETWSNGPLGLEQSFEVAHRPAGIGALTLAVAVPAGSRQVGQSIRLPGGLSYTGLRATDSTGRALRSWLQLSGDRVLLHVEDARAVYPIKVDPFVQQAQLDEPGTPSTEDEFGYAVAISGTTIVVGATHVNTGGLSASGAAYVFQQGSSGSWTETATLTPSDPVSTAQFGYSVAISGNTIVVGEAPAQGTTYSLSPPENVYIFEGQNGTWQSGNQTTELPAQVNGGISPSFGAAVAVDGNTVVVGAPSYSRPQGGENGAAFVYTLSSTGAVASGPFRLDDIANPDSGAQFAYSVAVSGSTVVVGDPITNNLGSAYIYSEPVGGWADSTSPSYALAPSDPGSQDEFGYAVAADSGTVVVAAPLHSGASGNVQQEGALYVFDQQSGGGWPATQSAELTPSDPKSVAGTELGSSGVAISGSTIVGGTAEGNGSLNAAAGYVFSEPQGGWSGALSQTQELDPTVMLPASAAGNHATLTAVGISGTTVVLGSDTSGYGSGSAYVFGPQALTTTQASTVGIGSVGGVAISGDALTAKSACAGASTTSCKLTYSLTSRETVKKGKAVAVAASVITHAKKKKAKVKTVTIGSAKLVVLAGGATERVKLTLNRTGKALLARFTKLPAYLTVTQAQTTGAPKVISKKKVTFHAKKTKRKKK